mmetsp:Transcript_137919/g.239791  ORF Transcript_137919/g.239791 Transcript_137919/m.239791 type:complete len:463 (+) Transcript_137919:131-1519(+)
MLVSRRCGCGRLALLQASLVLGSLVKEELSEKLHQRSLQSGSASGEQLADEAALLQHFLDVDFRKDKVPLETSKTYGLLLEQEARASENAIWAQESYENAMQGFNAALRNEQSNELTENPLSNEELSVVEQRSNDTVTTEQHSPFNLLLYNEIVFEVSQQNGTLQHKSKIALALLEGFFVPALLGVDRCYMGQPLLGVLKGISFGGCMIWYLIDYIVICVNMFEQKATINTLGFSADFKNDQVSTALLITICFLVVHYCCYSGCGIGFLRNLLGTIRLPAPGTDDVVAVSRHQEVHLSYKTITGNEALIYGDHNHIEGGWHQVIGNCNVVDGRGCYVTGDSNLVHGMNCNVNGDGNDVNGLSNTVNGAHNKNSGSNQRNQESKPFRQSEFEKYQAKRVVGRRDNPGIRATSPVVNNTKREWEEAEDGFEDGTSEVLARAAERERRAEILAEKLAARGLPSCC